MQVCGCYCKMLRGLTFWDTLYIQSPQSDGCDTFGTGVRLLLYGSTPHIMDLSNTYTTGNLSYNYSTAVTAFLSTTSKKQNMLLKYNLHCRATKHTIYSKNSNRNVTEIAIQRYCCCEM